MLVGWMIPAVRTSHPPPQPRPRSWSRRVTAVQLVGQGGSSAGSPPVPGEVSAMFRGGDPTRASTSFISACRPPNKRMDKGRE